MIVRLTVPVDKSDAARVEMKRSPQMPDKLNVGMPAGVNRVLLRVQILAHFILRRLRQEDVIKRLRRAVISQQEAPVIHRNPKHRLERLNKRQIVGAELS